MFRQGWNFCYRIVNRFYRDGCTTQAAGLAYVTLLSIVPLMTVSLSILSAFPVFKGIGNEVQELVFSNFVASSAQVIVQHLQAFISQTMKLSLSGTVSLIITAVLLIFSMESAFNRIWQVKERRNALQAFYMYWAVLTLSPVLLGLGITVSSYLISLKFISKAAAIPTIRITALLVAPYIITFFSFIFLYVAIPNTKVKIHHAALGAFIAALFFEAAKFGFTFYIQNFPTYKLLYGALAAIPIFLVWIYVSWLIVLFGAVISHELQIGTLSTSLLHTS